MAFTITDSDGNVTEEVWSCTECIWLSTKRHCKSTDDGPACVLCGSPCKKSKTITKSTGMSDFKYRELLSHLEEDADGVGAATVENIQEYFEEGDDFLDAAEAAHQEMELGELQSVDGVGEASAKSIALTIADEEGWENGAIFRKT